MNPLTFQMQISNSLETQIKHYTEELNKLLSIANGKEIKIGVSDSLTQLVAELQKGMLNITKAQNESPKLKLLKQQPMLRQGLTNLPRPMTKP